eukprot:CAMPEP_0172776876 /NCGR_PEP_ID=MMETSP1074-20121228/200754_1 /TAXON_ID=2916 /ORGANISM="Ceratium fusus, Strain PA161109" /LENGTH=47 /DNA_ID= /DNA_START= /DNA_END= /DNA_ORIENTATION=
MAWQHAVPIFPSYQGGCGLDTGINPSVLHPKGFQAEESCHHHAAGIT